MFVHEAKVRGERGKEKLVFGREYMDFLVRQKASG